MAGGSLRNILDKQGHLPVEQAVRIASDVAEGLAATHAKSIVHRDIKPENILLTAEGRAKVGDFGIAHVPRGAGGTTLTQVGFQPGTLIYMSPEQIQGQVVVDGRSDVYQIGVLLYELLTGRHYVDIAALEEQSRQSSGGNVMKFQARLYDLLEAAICEAKPESLTRLRPETPLWLAEAIAMAMTKNIQDRPTAEVWAKVLKDGKKPAHSLNSLFNQENQCCPQCGQEVPNQARFCNHCGRSFTDIKSSTSPLTGEPIIATNVKRLKVVMNLETKEKSFKARSAFAFSPNGELLAIGGFDGKLELWQILGNSLLQTWQAHSKKVFKLTFSPDGTMLASTCTDDKTTRLWQIADGRLLHTFKGGWSAAFSPDSKLLATADSYGPVQLYRLNDGKSIQILDRARFARLAFSPTKKLLAISQSDDDEPILIIQIKDKQIIRTLNDTSSNKTDISSIAFSPDGELLAEISSGAQSYLIIKVWHISSEKLLYKLIGHEHTSFEGYVAFNSDGTLLISYAANPAVCIWQVSDGQLLYALGPFEADSGRAFSSNGKLIVIQSEFNRDEHAKIQIWGVPSPFEDDTHNIQPSTNPEISYAIAKAYKHQGSAEIWEGHPNQAIAKFQNAIKIVKDYAQAHQLELRNVALWDFAGKPHI